MIEEGSGTLEVRVALEPAVAAAAGWPRTVAISLWGDGRPVTTSALSLGEIQAKTPLDFVIGPTGRSGADTQLAVGYTSWGPHGMDDPTIAWHAHRPCRHGKEVVDAARCPSVPEDGFEDDADSAMACLRDRARLIVDVVARAASAPVPSSPPPTAGTPEPGRIAALEALVADLMPTGTTRAALAAWRGNGIRALLEATAREGWDVAVVAADTPSLVVLTHPDELDDMGEGDAHPLTAPSGPPRGTTYYWRDTVGDTADYVSFGCVTRCMPGAYVASISGDIAEWHHTSPVTSKPSSGWMSIVGDNVIFVNVFDDDGDEWSGRFTLEEGAWPDPPSMRDWILAVRQMVFA